MSCHHGEREPVGLQAELDVVRMDALVAAAQSVGEIGRGTGGSYATEVGGRVVITSMTTATEAISVNAGMPTK